MVQGSSTMIALAGVATWIALAFVGLVRAAGGTVPNLAALGCALVAAPIALAAAIQACVAFWRGPTILAFGHDDAVSCSPSEAAFVRASAQLRGTMGGAGHLYPRRLALPALAWLAAAVVGLGIHSDRLDEVVGPWPVAITLASAFAAFLLPARQYFYRETGRGGAIVSPREAAYRLKHRAARAANAAALASGETVEGRIPAPTPTPTPALPIGMTPSCAGADERAEATRPPSPSVFRGP